MTMNTAAMPVLCQRYHVAGMTCSHCERAVAHEVGSVPGVVSATADAATGTLVIECTTAPDINRLAVAVVDAGYELVA